MTSFSRDVRGAVTPAVCIFAAVIVLLNFLMLDVARVYALESFSCGIESLGAYSVLAEFDGTLQRDYGLYGVNIKDKSALENRFYEILCIDDEASFLGTAESEKYPWLNLMNYDVTKAAVALEQSLGDIYVLREQISAVMKYESAGNIIVKLAEQLASLADLSSMAGIFGKYAEVTGLYDSYKAGLKNLDIAINGAVSGGLEGVNGIKLVPMCSGDSQVRLIEQNILPVGSSYSEETADILKGLLSVYATPAAVYAEYNETAETECAKVMDIVRDSEGKLSEIDEWLANYEPKESYEESFKSSMEDMIDKIRSGFSAARLGSIRSTLQENRRALESAYSEWTRLEQYIVAGSSISKDEVTYVAEAFADCYKDYKTVEFSASGGDSSQGKDYSDCLLENDVAGYFANVTGEYAQIPSEVYNDLPSVKYENSFEYFLTSIEDISGVETCEGISSVLEDCKSLGALVNAGLSEVADRYYADDYIMSYFTSSAYQGESVNRFMKGEIEYVIAGSGSEETNINDVYAKLTELRIGLNLVHILCDNEKLDLAKTAGESMSALTYGAGAPLYTAMVMVSWATAEALVDITDLERGSSVPLIKKKGDWKTAVSGETFGSAFLGNGDKDNVTDSDDFLSMDYTEYLRILLLQVPLELKLYRIQDIIELNLYKASNTRVHIGDFYGAVRCEAGFAMKTMVLINKSGDKKYVAEESIYVCA